MGGGCRWRGSGRLCRGARIELAPVGDAGAARPAFSSPGPGFIRVDLMVDRRIRLEVTVIDQDHAPRQGVAAWPAR